jgi:hypothetical protein
MKIATIRRAYPREATVTLFLARLALRLWPVRQIFSWIDRPLRKINRFADNEVAWTAWAVGQAARRSGLKTLCLPCALAMHAMLRRRGIGSRVCLGVSRDNRQLVAHAWVEVGGTAFMAETDIGPLQDLARFGGEAHSHGVLGQ